MNEFSLINTYFKTITHQRDDVILGIDDDAACLSIPPGQQLLVSCDTLLVDVHFLSTWDPYDIAYRAVMVNVSDIAAMGGTPSWLILALTLPDTNDAWLAGFSRGLRDALNRFNIALVGGDTTRGPLSMTLTIHGLVPEGQAVCRHGAQPGDKIYVSGELGAAALAVADLTSKRMNHIDRAEAMKKLLSPQPRLDLAEVLRLFATAAIDISDGLSADLNHICVQSKVGACLMLDSLPVHPLLKHYEPEQALDFVLGGGDDYELCFTVPPEDEAHLLEALVDAGLTCYLIGVIEEQPGLRLRSKDGQVSAYEAKGYRHF